MTARAFPRERRIAPSSASGAPIPRGPARARASAWRSSASSRWRTAAWSTPRTSRPTARASASRSRGCRGRASRGCRVSRGGRRRPLPDVRREVRPWASLAAAILGSVLAFSLASCAGSPSATPSVAATATDQPTARPTAFPPPSGVAWLEDGRLQPGTYWFNGFDPWLEVRVGEGWEVGHFHRDFFDLFYSGDFPSIGFGRFP